jgi:IS1 family transposase
MNVLPLEKRVQIINLLVEGNSLRGTSRIADVSINSVTKVLVTVGRACQVFHDQKVRNIKSERVQCDEIWSFVYSKEKNTAEEDKGTGVGDVWTWVGIDADTKLVISWYVGNRSAEDAYIFMKDVKRRLRNRVQLTTDGFKAYLNAVPDAFGSRIDYAQLIKLYDDNGRYKGAERRTILGKPDKKKITTAHVERQNLTMRMHMRRFARKTNAFSKKVENHCYAQAIHFVYYNFVRIHKTLRVTPAMQAGIVKEPMELIDLAQLIE